MNTHSDILGIAAHAEQDRKLMLRKKYVALLSKYQVKGIRIYWPDHVNIRGNKRADSLVRKTLIDSTMIKDRVSLARTVKVALQYQE